MVTYLKDTDAVEKYTTDWEPVNTQGILQVVSTIKTDTFSTTSGTFGDVTGLTVTITPTSASSKVLIIAQFGAGAGTDPSQGFFRINGGNASTYVGDAAGSRARASAMVRVSGANQEALRTAIPVSITFLDSPATTSAVTYALQARVNQGTVFVNRSGEDTDAASLGRTSASITVLEVAG
jgi:hypothetical protein